MAVVSKSFGIVYPVRYGVVGDGQVVEYETLITFSADDRSVLYGARIRVTANSFSLQHAVRQSVSPGKVFSVRHGVRKSVSTYFSELYDTLVPITGSTGGAFSSAYDSAYDSAPSSGEGQRSFSLVYGVRSSVNKSVSVVYDTDIVGITTVSKSVGIIYHTLTTPTVDDVLIEPFYPDPVPPQVVTTTSF